MQQPHVDNVIVDEERKVRFNVKAYRKLTRNELLQAVRFAISGMKRKPKRNSDVTIVSIIGYER